LNFVTGDYTYTPTEYVNHVETVNVSIADGDGDVLDTILLDINVVYDGSFNPITYGLSEVNMITSQNTTDIVTGSVSDNIDYGVAGPGQIDSITYNGIAYNSADYPTGVTIAMQNGGSLVFDFATGAYTFDNTAGSATAEEMFAIVASDSAGSSQSLDLKLSAAGNLADTYTEDFTNGVVGWGPQVSQVNGAIEVGRDETSTRVL